MADAANVYSPDADPNGTAEEQIKYIVEEANSGKKLTTEQILTLQTALAGAQTIQNTQLRAAASGILQQQANQLGATGRELTTSNNATIQDQRNLALGAAAGDADVAQQVQNAGTATTAMDLSGLQQTADAYGSAAAQGYANAGQYADTVQQAKGAYAQNLGVLRTATGTSNAEDLALFDQYAKSAGATTDAQKAALNDYLGSTAGVNASQEGTVGGIRTAGTTASTASKQALNDYLAQSGIANTAEGGAVGNLANAAGASAGQQNALLGRLDTSGGTANLADAQALNDLRTGVANAGAGDELALSQLRAGADVASGKQLGALQTLDTAGGRANTLDQQALAGLTGGAGTANTADTRTLAELRAAAADVPHVYGPEYGADVVSQAGRATADPDSIAAQKRFLSSYEADSSPTITDAERFNLEIARRQREQEDRAALEATLRDLGARGIRSGGAEIGSLLGSAQNTGQERMLADLAASRDAVARAERARASGANLASDMRSDSFGEQMQAGTAADAVAQFNKSQSQTAQRYAADLEHQQATEGFGRAQAVAGAQTAATGSAYQRAQDVYKAGQQTAASGYDRSKDTSTLQNQQALDEYSRNAGLEGEQRDTTADQFAREQNLFNADQGTAQQQYHRTQDVVGTGLDVAGTQFGQQQAVTGAQTGAAQDLYSRAADANTAQQNAAQQTYANTQDANKAALDVAAQEYGRAQDTLGAAQGTAADAYQRTGDLYNAGTDLSAAQYGRANNLYGDVNAAANDIVANAGTVADRNAAATQNYTDLTGQLLNEGQQTSGTAYDRATDAAKADQAGIDNAYTRLAGTDAAQRDVNKDAFNQAVQGFDASAQAQGVATGSTPSPIYDALGNVIGYNEERRAEDELNKKSLLEAITGGIL